MPENNSQETTQSTDQGQTETSPETNSQENQTTNQSSPGEELANSVEALAEKFTEKETETKTEVGATEASDKGQETVTDKGSTETEESAFAKLLKSPEKKVVEEVKDTQEHVESKSSTEQKVIEAIAERLGISTSEAEQGVSDEGESSKFAQLNKEDRELLSELKEFLREGKEDRLADAAQTIDNQFEDKFATALESSKIPEYQRSILDNMVGLTLNRQGYDKSQVSQEIMDLHVKAAKEELALLVLNTKAALKQNGGGAPDFSELGNAQDKSKSFESKNKDSDESPEDELHRLVSELGSA